MGSRENQNSQISGWEQKKQDPRLPAIIALSWKDDEYGKIDKLRGEKSLICGCKEILGDDPKPGVVVMWQSGGWIRPTDNECQKWTTEMLMEAKEVLN